MFASDRTKVTLIVCVARIVAASGWKISAQTTVRPINDAPNPYKTVENYFKLPGTSGPEGVAADAQGNVYGAEVGQRGIKKYVRK